MRIGEHAFAGFLIRHVLAPELPVREEEALRSRIPSIGFTFTETKVEYSLAVQSTRCSNSAVGRSGGAVPEFNPAALFFRRNRIGGVSAGDYTPEAAQAAWRQIVGRLDATAKRPVVDRVFAFGDVKVAFARLAQGPMGKVLVRGTA